MGTGSRLLFLTWHNFLDICEYSDSLSVIENLFHFSCGLVHSNAVQDSAILRSVGHSCLLATTGRLLQTDVEVSIPCNQVVHIIRT